MTTEPLPSETDTQMLARLGTDGATWAAEFVRAHRGWMVGGYRVDHGLMLAWFANAIMAGHDWGYALAKREHTPALLLDQEVPARGWPKPPRPLADLDPALVETLVKLGGKYGQLGVATSMVLLWPRLAPLLPMLTRTAGVEKTLTAREHEKCPHCGPQHGAPTRTPWHVLVGPNVDSDRQPIYLIVQPAAGAHVAEEDAEWLRQLIWQWAETSAAGDSIRNLGNVNSAAARAYNLAVLSAERPDASDEDQEEYVRSHEASLLASKPFMAAVGATVNDVVSYMAERSRGLGDAAVVAEQDRDRAIARADHWEKEHNRRVMEQNAAHAALAMMSRGRAEAVDRALELAQQVGDLRTRVEVLTLCAAIAGHGVDPQGFYAGTPGSDLRKLMADLEEAKAAVRRVQDAIDADATVEEIGQALAGQGAGTGPSLIDRLQQAETERDEARRMLAAARQRLTALRRYREGMEGRDQPAAADPAAEDPAPAPDNPS